MTMTLTRTAIGNLLARYRAVLRKCAIFNAIGTPERHGFCVLGGGDSRDGHPCGPERRPLFGLKRGLAIGLVTGMLVLGWLAADASTAFANAETVYVNDWSYSDVLYSEADKDKDGVIGNVVYVPYNHTPPGKVIEVNHDIYDIHAGYFIHEKDTIYYPAYTGPAIRLHILSGASLYAAGIIAAYYDGTNKDGLAAYDWDLPK